MTRYLVAPDKFKGTLTGREAADAIAAGLRDADPTATIVELPFADGGEGTVDAVVAAGGVPMRSTVAGPLGPSVEAAWTVLDGVAFVEMAEASGLRHVSPDPRTASLATTAGTGALLAAALEARVERIVVGLGGSSTTDAGFGALRTLGVRFVDAAGLDVANVERCHEIVAIDRTQLDPRLASVAIDVCCDVDAPLAGPAGAAHVFGPQKGATPEAVAELDARLQAFAGLFAALPGGRAAVDGGGAAGGLAAGLVAVLGARMRPGVEVLADLLGLDDRIRESDLVIVGEGSLDAQSSLGKTPVGVARRARSLGVPVVAVVGTSAFAPDALAHEGIVRIHALDRHASDPAQALRDAAGVLRAVSAEVAREHVRARADAVA